MRISRLLFFGLLLFAGCAAMRAHLARESTLIRELDAYVIPKPLPEAWESVSVVTPLFWHGTMLTWEDDGPWRKRSSSRTDKYQSDGDDHINVTWLECEGREAPNGSQVRYFEVTERTTYRQGQKLGTTDKSVDRRTDLELELVKRFDAPAAQRIHAAAEKAAAAAE